MLKGLFAPVFIVLLLVLCQGEARSQQVPDSTRIKGHPRLLLLPGEEAQIRAGIEKDTVWRNLHNSILKECDAILLLQPLEREVIGRRLLHVSRESLRRVFYLSYAWRMTGNKAYFNRCEEELLTVSKFRDWNPSHFLDVAEMTMAASIGYDWLYNELPATSRELISRAIIEKGLRPSLDNKYNDWLRRSNNWNQVCNGGITFGAIAVYEDQPQVSLQLIKRALSSILTSMKEYAPDGNYNEGYGYWGYGTSFNVFFIDALEKLFGTDFGLSRQPGFLKTAAFYENLTGSSGSPFNYSDCGSTEGLQPAMFWFADKLGDPSLLFVEKNYLLNSAFRVKSNRLLPAAMLWGKGIRVSAIKAPGERVWAGKGENQVVMMRTAWEKKPGIFVGFKGGTPSVSHAHMDGGSFVMDADGVRWSADPGMQDYNSLESAGLSIWDMGQNSQRWQVFRYSNLSHSTLTVNHHPQNVKGHAVLVSSSTDSLNYRAVMDLSSLYDADLKKAQRGIAIINKRYVTVRDEIETGDGECTIRWAMLTPAKVVRAGENQALLENKGKRLTLSVAGLPGVVLKTWSTEPPKSYDALNPGTVLVGFEFTVPPHTKRAFNVLLTPDEGKGAVRKPDLRELSEW